MGQNGTSSPQKWLEQSTPTYMGSQPPTRWSTQKSAEGSKSVRMRHKNDAASKDVKNWLPTRVSNFSEVDGLVVRDHFIPKNGLKTAILGEQILDSLGWDPNVDTFGQLNKY